MEELSKLKKARNIGRKLIKVVKRIFEGKCICCGECKEKGISGEICANRDCEKCGLNNGV